MMAVAQTKLPKGPHRPGHYATSVLAYLVAGFVPTFALPAMNGAVLDFGTIGLTGAMVCLLGLIPFVVIKTIMARYAWDGVLPHILGGALAAVAGFLVLGRWGLMNGTLMVYLPVFGAVAGLVYWATRKGLRKMVMGVAE